MKQRLAESSENFSRVCFFEAFEVGTEEVVEVRLGLVFDRLAEDDFGEVLGGGEFAEVFAEGGEAVAGVGLGDAIEAFALDDEELVDDEEAAAPGEAVTVFAGTGGDRTNQAPFWGEDGEDAIGFAEVAGFEVDAFGAVGAAHGEAWDFGWPPSPGPLPPNLGEGEFGSPSPNIGRGI